MILLFFLFFFVFFLYQKERAYTKFYPLLSILIPLVLYLLFVLEVQFTSIEYFISDELKYFNVQANDFYSYLDRLIWYSINIFEKKFDILPQISLKLINIPILFFFLYYTWKIFDKNNNIFYAVVFIPYLAIIATKDIRDVLILFLTTLTIYLFNHKKKYYISIIPMILLFFTRNFIVFAIIGVWLFVYFLRGLKKFFRGLNKKTFRFNPKQLIVSFSSVVLFVAIIGISRPYIKKKYRSYKFRIEYFLTDYHNTRLVNNNGIKTGNILTDYFMGGVKYGFTPIPTSIFKRMLFSDDNSYQYGKLDDFIRGINQSIYYVLLFYILFYYKYLYRGIRQLTDSQKFLIINLLMYLPIYTFYSFGGGHQRIKIPFQFAIYLLFIITYRFKIYSKKEVRDEEV